MSNRLVGEARPKLPEDEIRNEGSQDQGKNADREMCVTHQNEVSNSRDRAEPTTLRQEVDRQSGVRRGRETRRRENS